MSKLSIALNKPTGSVYMPGEIINGVVHVDMDEPVSYEYIYIVIEGRGDVRIVEHRTHTDTSDYEDIFTASEVYLTSKISLLPFQGTLRKGRTSFPFQYCLPATSIPCSFKAPNGRIRYNVAVHLKQHNESLELRQATRFIVGPHLDLNAIRLNDYFRSTHFKQKKSVGGCFSCLGSSKVIKLDLIVPKRVFIPGDYIGFHMTIDNQSKTVLESGVMKFVLFITCVAQGVSRVKETILGQIAGPEVRAGCVHEWNVNNLWVPVIKPRGIPPSGLGGCNIIHAQYCLQYHATLEDGCGQGCVRFFVPLVVGTVGLKA